jgi:hypothetical protein
MTDYLQIGLVIRSIYAILYIPIESVWSFVVGGWPRSTSEAAAN